MLYTITILILSRQFPPHVFSPLLVFPLLYKNAFSDISAQLILVLVVRSSLVFGRGAWLHYLCLQILHVFLNRSEQISMWWRANLLPAPLMFFSHVLSFIRVPSKPRAELAMDFNMSELLAGTMTFLM